MARERDGNVDPRPFSGPASMLHSAARVRAIDRRMRNVAFARAVGRWIAFPVVAAAVLFLLVLLILGPAELVPRLLVPGTLVLVVLGVLSVSWRELRAEERRLRSERAADRRMPGRGPPFRLKDPRREARSG